MIKLNVIFQIGQIVYPRACPYQYPRIITGFSIRGENNRITYLASSDDNEREYEAFELSDNRNFKLIT